MPRIVQHTPTWLSRGTPGFEVFDVRAGGKQGNGDPARPTPSLPLKTLARRNTQIYVAVGDEVRWADLVNLKELNENEVGKQNDEWWNEALKNKVYKRIGCRSPFGGIKQLVLSPNEQWMAVVGSHMINIVKLPTSEQLDKEGTDIAKVRHQFTLGPVIHVNTQSALACVLWHPLGAHGQCLVTITKDAVVRVWEMKFEDRMSFEQPTQTIDLKRLADATSAQEDVQGSGRRMTNTFSPYDSDFEPVAACFGGAGDGGESPWSVMTLWVATRDGDIYALSPLLPKKWQASQQLVDDALFLASARAVETKNDDSMVQWAQDLAAQEPYKLSSKLRFGEEEAGWMYTRPRAPDEIPALQGPFVLSTEMQEWDPELCDIIVTDMNKQDRSDMRQESIDFLSDEGEMSEPAGQSSSIVCLSTVSGQIYVTLCLEGIEPQWLPPKAAANDGLQQALQTDHDRADRQLLVLDSFNVKAQSATDSSSRPTFTADIMSPFAFCISHATGVDYLSVRQSVESLKEEMEEADSAFRIDTLLESASSQIESLVQYRISASGGQHTNSVILEDSDLGYLLLTTDHASTPYACELDSKIDHPPIVKTEDPESSYHDSYTSNLAETVGALTFSSPPEPYQPDTAFYADIRPGNWKRQSQIPSAKHLRLSQETLEDLTHIHRILAEETTNLSRAAADLFRRCEALQAEYVDQIGKVGEISEKIEHIVGDEEDETADGEGDDAPAATYGTRRIEDRIDMVFQRERTIAKKRREVQKKVMRLQQGVVALSDKETGWSREVDDAAKSLQLSSDKDTNGVTADHTVDDSDNDSISAQLKSGLAGLDVNAGAHADLLARFEALTTMKAKLIAEAQRTLKQVESRPGSQDGQRSASPRIASKFRRQKEQAVRELLEREEAMIQAVGERVERLAC